MVYKKASGRLYLLKKIRSNLTAQAANTIFLSNDSTNTYVLRIRILLDYIKRFERRAAEIIKSRKERNESIEALGITQVCL